MSILRVHVVYVVCAPLLCMLICQRKMLGVLLCYALSYSFDTVSLTDPEAKLMAATPVILLSPPLPQHSSFRHVHGYA